MRRRGRAFGAKRKLSAEQEKEVQKLITDKTPDQLKMKYALWTREAVRELTKAFCPFRRPEFSTTGQCVSVKGSSIGFRVHAIR